MKPDIKNLTLVDLRASLEQIGQPSYRAGQIFSWIYQKGAEDFSSMTNLSKDLRDRLDQEFENTFPRLIKKETSSDGTEKYLFELSDSNRIETVHIPSSDRGTVCLSTQVGCKSGCAFCASGAHGFVRDLAPGEILSQILFLIFKEQKQVTNLVFMGIGEPLDNLDNLLIALDIINLPEGLNIGARRITVSTCGIVPAMRKLADNGKQFELSISLHASDDELRQKLVPINKKYPIAELVSAARYYLEKVKRPVTFEYVLLKDFNDDARSAKKLATLAKEAGAKVNLIPFNVMDGYDYAPPSPAAIDEFQRILHKSGITAIIRTPRGQDITAACGQLRIKSDNSSK
jgi:23S rRNA (adenine2503-C2)-methyltransferase